MKIKLIKLLNGPDKYLDKVLDFQSDEIQKLLETMFQMGYWPRIIIVEIEND